MVYALVGLAVIALSEGGGLLCLWTRYRALQDEAAVSTAVAGGLMIQLASAYGDLAAARAALAKQNDLEAKSDVTVVSTNPDLDAALGRINGL